ncbi:hypothetical protein GDO81_001710 [Engystomops pustulosus]|uniref:Uncharacterized protein n=1 Tax=Engystomops pustulosus TaxID=76066 RepID=A0AAV7DEZ5_ENGPU|nr:hypothetical protein GDO81_001710 [Engystomops pustulosus]
MCPCPALIPTLHQSCDNLWSLFGQSESCGHAMLEPEKGHALLYWDPGVHNEVYDLFYECLITSAGWQKLFHCPGSLEPCNFQAS